MSKLLTINEAAEKVGLKPCTLRGIIDRSRRKLAGHPVYGPTMKFFQLGKNSPIRIREDWLEEFIAANTQDPSTVEPVKKPMKPKAPAPRIPTTVQIHGFDPKLFDI